MAAALAATRTGPGSAPATLGPMRWKMVRLLRAYQIFKHSEIFDPAIASGSPTRAAAAHAMKARCIAAGETFRHYVVTWTARDVAAAWDEYQPAMKRMIADLRAHIAIERHEIGTALADIPHTRAA